MTLGRMVERADMTARIIDVGAGDILDREGAFSGVEPLLWGALLEALSGRSAYRKTMGPIIEQNPMIDFVFKAPTFPRSLFFCIDMLRANSNNCQSTRMRWPIQIKFAGAYSAIEISITIVPNCTSLSTPCSSL